MKISVSIGTVRIHWQGKQSLFYVRRIGKAGQITGHWTGRGWCPNGLRAVGFQSEQAVTEAMQACGCRTYQILDNRNPSPLARVVNRCIAEGSPVIANLFS